MIIIFLALSCVSHQHRDDTLAPSIPLPTIWIVCSISDQEVPDTNRVDIAVTDNILSLNLNRASSQSLQPERCRCGCSTPFRLPTLLADWLWTICCRAGVCTQARCVLHLVKGLFLYLRAQFGDIGMIGGLSASPSSRFYTTLHIARSTPSNYVCPASRRVTIRLLVSLCCCTAHTPPSSP